MDKFFIMRGRFVMSHKAHPDARNWGTAILFDTREEAEAALAKGPTAYAITQAEAAAIVAAHA